MTLLKATAIDSRIEASEIASRGEMAEPEDFVRQKPRDRKKTWGIFYTPIEVSRCLADWAITNRDDVVLEPSFGGCGFLNEAARALRKKGSHRPWQQLCGCDKDLAAFVHLPPVYARKARRRRFLHHNFLETKPADYCHQEFSVVIGNPPYVSRHNMRKYQLSSAAKINLASGGLTSGRASLWVYFIIHSLQFLKIGGRMAWVLPRSLSQSNYGREMVRLLCERFESVTVISVTNRLFLNSGAEELIDVLLCAKHQPLNKIRVNPLITYADSVNDLRKKIETCDTASSILPVDISSGRQEMLTHEERYANSSSTCTSVPRVSRTHFNTPCLSGTIFLASTDH
jgi:type I restriction-modification system DNA methylase subunit